MPFNETIVALSTPGGESAIALIRLSGNLCYRLVTNIFEIEKVKPRYSTLGKYRNLGGAIIDEVLFTYFQEKESYTGEQMLEISTHGSPYIISKVIDDLLERSCRMAEPGEFTKTAFLNGKMDLSQAEAVIDVIKARSDRALETAQRQLQGSIGAKVDDLIQKLLFIVARVEAYIDFPEEDLPSGNESGPVRELKELQEEINNLISTSHYRKLLHEGVKTVIVGAPNAGKSSLLNALTGEDRVIVCEEPGTTRDFVEERILIGSYLLRVIDTAGLHDPESKIEKMGIEKTIYQFKTADLLLYVVDSTEESPTLSENLGVNFKKQQVLVVENKCDLESSRAKVNFLPQFRHMRVSALLGTGMSELRKQIESMLEDEVILPIDDHIVINARHSQALEEARKSLVDAMEKVVNEEVIELIASDLHHALNNLEEIAGKIDNEAMLDKLFANFCIGK